MGSRWTASGKRIAFPAALSDYTNVNVDANTAGYSATAMSMSAAMLVAMPVFLASCVMLRFGFVPVATLFAATVRSAFATVPATSTAFAG